jgi:hypothetical protein
MRQEWFNPSNGRRYLVELFEDLLGDWVLVRCWAGANRPGNQKMAVIQADAFHQLKSIEALRRKRGYQRVM